MLNHHLYRRVSLGLIAAMLAIALILPSHSVAQNSQQHFVDVDGAPFGAGDRSLTMKIQLVPNDTTANVQVWVVYSENPDQVEAGDVGSAVPHGRAKLGTVTSSGVLDATFIFPHSDNQTPNLSDSNAVRIRSGRGVFYKVVKVRGNTRNSSAIQSFLMPDKLTIVNFGDSYASGEGAPYYSSNPALARPEDLWDNPKCHRNGNSGQARAVSTLKRENPGTAIAFLNVACSGAEIKEGIQEGQLKPSWAFEPEHTQDLLPPQGLAAARWLADNGYSELNIAMVTAGGNDAGFGWVVENYLIAPGVFRAGDDAATQLEQRIRVNTPQQYLSLRDEFDRLFTYDHVLVSELPDPLRGSDGQFCELDPTLVNPRSEFKAIHDSFLSLINSTIRDTIAAFPKWKHASGTMAASRGHGLCNTNDPYFHKGLVESFFEQGDPYGTAHPNRRGHMKTFQPVYEAHLRQALRALRIKWAKEEAKREVREKVAAAQARQRQRLASVVTSATKVPTNLKPLVLNGKAPTALSARKLDAATASSARQRAAQLPRPPAREPDNRMTEDRE